MGRPVEHEVAEWVRAGKPLPDPSAVELAVVLLVDHDDRERRRFHDDRVQPFRLLARLDEWEHKYPSSQGYYGHRCLLARTPRPPRGFDDRLYDKIGRAPCYFENTDYLPTYRASASVTNAIEGLATSSTLLAGYESATVDLSSTKSIDLWLSGVTTVGTTPTANTRIEHHVVSEIADGVWPDVFDGSTGAETITSQGIKDTTCKRLVSLNVDANTSNRAYPYTKRSVAVLFGLFVPSKFVVFTTHNTAVNLNATGSNQVLTQTGVYLTS